MKTMGWIRVATEYALGLALVLAHLALAGRGIEVAGSLDDR